MLPALIWILEAIVVLVAVRQFAIIANKPGFRRETVWKTGWKLPLLGSAAIIGSVGIWAALRWPVLRHVGVAGLAAFMAAAWWRARPSYGRLRGLPPGSLGLGHSLDALNNQRYYLEQAARFGPVFKSSEFGNPVVCVIGLSRARAILAAHGAAFSGAKFTKRYQRFIPGGVLRYMDPGRHREFAPRFRAAYGSLQLDGAEPLLRAIYRSNLARLAADSTAGPGGTSAHPYLRRAMLEVVGYLFYGLPPGEPLLNELERCLPLLIGPALGERGWRRKTREGLDGVTAIMSRVRSRWAQEGGSGFRSALRGLVDTTPSAIDDRTIAGNFVLISHIAHGDLAGLHMWIFKFLSDHPAVLDTVRSGRSNSQVVPGGVVDAGTRIVMETIRMEQSEFLYRRVTRSFEYEGMTFPAGWMIRFCTQESHRDPAVFAEPDRFDPDRFARRAYSREEYAPFGADTHGCMGSHIAHFAGRLFVEELASGFDWRVVADSPAEKGANRHRGHWRPSSLHRVVMSSRPR